MSCLNLRRDHLPEDKVVGLYYNKPITNKDIRDMTVEEYSRFMQAKEMCKYDNFINKYGFKY